MDKQIIDQLVRALARALGNKRYLDDIEKLLARLELTAQEREALRYLARDIQGLENDLHSAKNKPWSP